MNCPSLAGCPFFNGRMPAVEAAQKNQFCLGDNSSCARFMVAKALGKDNVPSRLYPHQKEKAEELIAKGCRK